VDLAQMAQHLGTLGHRCVVAEGGASLNGQLLADDLIDELNLTVAPLLVGGEAHRVVVGPEEHPRRLRLAHLWESDSSLLARYVRSEGP
jgi:riboflavin biosynthesis pyrimidine reductase